jgi:midasin (ATPase involved in ribosome maturation)
VTEQPKADPTNIGAVLAGAIGPYIATKVDEDQVIDLINKHASSMDVDTLHKLCVDIIKSHTAPMELVVKDAETNEVLAKLDRQHYKFELLLKCCIARVPVLMVGPAGSGKTTVANAVAVALKLPFEGVSFGPMTTKADLFGYQDANGIYHDTALVRTATKGGVFLGDEVDAGNAGVLTGVNMVLANGHIAIPTGMEEKHKDFVFVGAANTFGTGANRQYVGRNQLDAATLDRFAIIEWPYDEGLEAACIGVAKPSPKFDIAEGGLIKPEAWLDFVQSVRRVVDKLGIRTVISPRSAIYGAKLCVMGVGRTHLEEMLIWKGLEQATKDKITAAL